MPMAAAFTRALSAALLTPLRRLVRARGERLVVFTRYPVAGRAKTRLIPALGAEGAAELQRRMTEHVMWSAGALRCRRGAALEVRHAGGDGPAMREWLGPGVAYGRQGPGDLGERMARAFRQGFAGGDERIVLIGADCPGITPALLESAFQSLATHGAVLGPAADGGYYLLGLRRPAPFLFDGVRWGTGSVLRATLQRADRWGLRVHLLPTLADVDRPEDLPAWREAERRPAPKPLVSIVIPALNEAERVGGAIASALRGGGVEVIVADGGSADGTRDVALSSGARVLESERGRARQMNAGAAEARGELLLFLHADTVLPWGFDEGVRQALAAPGVVAGAFELTIGGGGAALRFIERTVTWRARYLQMPYADQGIFLRAETFAALGGFPEMPLMEDYELMRRLRREGRVAIVPAPAVTSGRRWRELGIVRTTAVNKFIVAAYRLGVSPERLARLYRSASFSSASAASTQKM